jgi:hypothetical protein
VRGACNGAEGDRWNLCGYDEAYAFRKVWLDFCGRSPDADQRAAFDASADRAGALHEALAACLRSEHWRGRDGVVWGLASPKIRPLASIKAGRDPGGIQLGDYDDDFALFVYTQIDDHDARDLLVADYFVAASAAPPTVYEPFRRTVDEDFRARPGLSTYQTIEPERRAGMITTRWFRAVNTMFSAVPRTSAAQAYRAYLGLDIALLEGLQPGVEAEPADYDEKGVRAEGCAGCHRTLDPLSYPFSRYAGLDIDPALLGGAMGGGGPGAGGGPPMPPSMIPIFRQYEPGRMARFVDVDGPRVVDVPEGGTIFGQPVADLNAWARVAVESDAFARQLVLDYWQALFGERPRPADEAVWQALADGLRTRHGYRVEAMLHDLVDTEAYGAP